MRRPPREDLKEAPKEEVAPNPTSSREGIGQQDLGSYFVSSRKTTKWASEANHEQVLRDEQRSDNKHENQRTSNPPSAEGGQGGGPTNCTETKFFSSFFPMRRKDGKKTEKLVLQRLCGFLPFCPLRF